MSIEGGRLVLEIVATQWCPKWPFLLSSSLVFCFLLSEQGKQLAILSHLLPFFPTLPYLGMYTLISVLSARSISAPDAF
ncbi:hypothetical protein V8C26DRAFT_394324 [Trichoderma gracile]